MLILLSLKEKIKEFFFFYFLEKGKEKVCNFSQVLSLIVKNIRHFHSFQRVTAVLQNKGAEYFFKRCQLLTPKTTYSLLGTNLSRLKLFCYLQYQFSTLETQLMLSSPSLRLFLLNSTDPPCHALPLLRSIVLTIP